MNSSVIDTSRLDHLIAYLRKLSTIDPRPLLDDWAKIIVEDNRAGVLAGLNKDDQPVSPPLKYRGGFSAHGGRRVGRLAGKSGARPTAVRTKAKDGVYLARRGAAVGAINNNLTTAQYKQLTGPFAAPRGDRSRVVTHFRVQTPQQGGDASTWVVKAGWVDVVDANGQPFYDYLFAAQL
jgi:hypothetical protein